MIECDRKPVTYVAGEGGGTKTNVSSDRGGGAQIKVRWGTDDNQKPVTNSGNNVSKKLNERNIIVALLRIAISILF